MRRALWVLNPHCPALVLCCAVLCVLHVQVWSLETREPVLCYENLHDLPLTSMALAPQTRQLITCSADRTIKVWGTSVNRKRVFLQETLLGHTQAVTGVSFQADVGLLLSSSARPPSSRNSSDAPAAAPPIHGATSEGGPQTSAPPGRGERSGPPPSSPWRRRWSVGLLPSLTSL